MEKKKNSGNNKKTPPPTKAKKTNTNLPSEEFKELSEDLLSLTRR